uniref:Reverse transcriptase domain-containing protein n=1 Tax=Astatotilapia calliptera TaxID=8154 RepID=A0AAX7SWL5_ASTCA
MKWLLRWRRTLRRATTKDLAPRTRMALFNVRSLSNKAFLLNDFFLTTGLDVLFLTETWTSPGEFIPFSELLPPDCAFFSSPRLNGRGGGLASVFKNKHEARLLPSPAYSSFEAQLLELTGSRTTLCVVAYRPPKYHKMFISEFADFLGSILFKYGSVIISGDFNIHVCCMDDQLAKDFLALTDSFNLIQWVNEPTHVKGHTLDLVFSFNVDICIKEIRNTGLSDHSPVIFDVDLGNTGQYLEAPLYPTRTINADTVVNFSTSFVNSPFIMLDCFTPHTLENFTNTLLTTCSSILSIVAPIKMKRPRTYSQCWLNDSVRALRRICRRDERKWRNDRLQSSYDILRISRSKFQTAARIAKAAFLSKIITTNGDNPRILFKIFNSVVNPCPSMPLPCSLGLCEKFSNYFLYKVLSLKSTLPLVTDSMSIPDCSATLYQFEPVSLSTLKRLIYKLNNTNSVHDALPSRIVKDCFNAIGPCLLSILNFSLLSGYVPAALKHAIIQPVLKKRNLDHSDFANYRPISKLPFLAKILEKVVLLQLQTFLDENNINDKFQSAFKQHHSTESALLRVFNDLLLMADNGRPSVLVLLDLSSAFDMVDHNILLARLEHTVGIKGTALDWFKSYLSNRLSSVHLATSSSSAVPVCCGVPHGSVLGPTLFSLYMLPLSAIFEKYHIVFHYYADDIQIYFELNDDLALSLNSFRECMCEVKKWLLANTLILNDKKTEIMIFGSNALRAKLRDALGFLTSSFSDTVRNLGVLFDSSFKLDKQVSAVVRSSFYQLRLISKARHYIPYKDLEKLIHAFVTSRLDYCNSLYCGLHSSLLHRLQTVQNAAARILTKTKKFAHITPVLADLHWLPVKYRIQFKILLFTFKITNNTAPSYLKELLNPYAPARALRSSSQLLLVQPRSRLKSRGDRSFALVAPELWNNLPIGIRASDSIHSFKSRLKTYLFKLAFSTS